MERPCLTAGNGRRPRGWLPGSFPSPSNANETIASRQRNRIESGSHGECRGDGDRNATLEKVKLARWAGPRSSGRELPETHCLSHAPTSEERTPETKPGFPIKRCSTNVRDCWLKEVRDTAPVRARATRHLLCRSRVIILFIQSPRDKQVVSSCMEHSAGNPHGDTAI